MASTQTEAMEKMIMKTINPLICELRLIDLADLICYLHLGQHNHIADIVDSACEQFFAPGYIGYREAGSVHAEWGEVPVVHIELVLNTPEATFEFELSLGGEAASVRMLRANDENIDPSQMTPLQVIRRSIDINTIVAA